MNTQIQTIAIDIDDVLAASTEAIRLSINSKLGINLQPEHYKVPGEYWGYYEKIFEEHAIEDTGLVQDFHTAIVDDAVIINPIDDAVSSISKIIKKYRVIFITARETAMEKTTRRWFSTHFDSSNIELYFSNNRINAEFKTKGELCIELGASILIDDNPGHCQSAIDNGIDAILFGEYGWHTKVPKDVIRCKDWESVLRYLDGR
jgi:5'(3')-deoxyribonucleotidase